MIQKTNEAENKKKSINVIIESNLDVFINAVKCEGNVKSDVTMTSILFKNCSKRNNLLSNKDQYTFAY